MGMMSIKATTKTSAWPEGLKALVFLAPPARRP